MTDKAILEFEALFVKEEIDKTEGWTREEIDTVINKYKEAYNSGTLDAFRKKYDLFNVPCEVQKKIQDYIDEKEDVDLFDI